MNQNSYAFTFESRPAVLPPPVEEFVGRDPAETPALLIVVGSSARRGGWSARAAVALAESMSKRGRRVVLGDLDLDAPELHEILGGGNQEGMADIFLYGASLQRVARPAGNGSFYFVPAGPYAPDPGEVMRHPRWDRVLAALAEAGVTLLAYVPADVSGLDALAEHVPNVIVLGEPEEAAPALPPAMALLAALSPGGAAAAPAPPPGAVPAVPDADALVDALIDGSGGGPKEDEPADAAGGSDGVGLDEEAVPADHLTAAEDRRPDEAAEPEHPAAAPDGRHLVEESEPADAVAAPGDGWLVEDAEVAGGRGAPRREWATEDPAAGPEEGWSALEADVEPESREPGTGSPFPAPEAEAARRARGLDPAADRLLHAREQGRVVPRAPVSEPAAPPEGEELLKEPGFVARERRPRRGTALLLVALAGVLVAGGWMAVSRYTAGSGSDAAPVAAPAAVEPEPEVAEPDLGEPLEEELGFSVAIEAHQDMALAQERIRSLSAAEPDLLFYLAPIEVDDIVYFRVLAGPTSESSAAERIMQRLVDAGHKSQVQAWDVRPTAWAYELGEFDELAEAEARRDELREAGISSYVVEVPFTRASRYRIYAGAYSGATEAEVMGELLREAGIDAPFLRRSGRPVP